MKRVKTGKRVLSIVLTVMMLVSLIPITAMADTGSSEKAWAGTAEGEILVKDTITKITNDVVEHELISNTPAAAIFSACAGSRAVRRSRPLSSCAHEDFPRT